MNLGLAISANALSGDGGAQGLASAAGGNGTNKT
jgi:hypothetical protein